MNLKKKIYFPQRLSCAVAQERLHIFRIQNEIIIVHCFCFFVPIPKKDDLKYGMLLEGRQQQNVYLLNSKSLELSPHNVEHIWTEGRIEYNLTRNSVSVCVLEQV